MKQDDDNHNKKRKKKTSFHKKIKIVSLYYCARLIVIN